ncbi:MAG: chromosomal replication initiator protein DnaA [Firmicutes bacterium]|nr:chromosomal replication initiator protein DnaA [Bacillota bacterium]
MAVAERPGTQFNPLFIYGGTGLGKTHLLHAIGNELEANKPGLKIHYTTCENFVNDYVNAIRQGAEKTNKVFRNKYRTLDVLMIDDIQFLINKHGTQEEFFHTFNDLYKNNSQIIVVSDRTPKELDTLEDRIKSRLSSGLIQDVQSPDYETRLAILMKKRDEEKLNVDDKALMVISQTVDSHVRDLEGFLTKTAFLAKIDGSKTATEHHAIDATRDFVSKAGCTQDNTPKALIEIIANYFRIKSSDMVGKRKNKEFVEARQIAMYFITEYFEDMPLLAVGKLFGNTDHTTVIYSRDKVKKEKAINHEFRKRIEEIEEQTKPQFTK